MMGVNPEVVAAISASLGLVMEGGDLSPELIAAITAATVHARGGAGLSVRMKRSPSIWAATGRQKVMDGRQFV